MVLSISHTEPIELCFSYTVISAILLYSSVKKRIIIKYNNNRLGLLFLLHNHINPFHFKLFIPHNHPQSHLKAIEFGLLLMEEELPTALVNSNTKNLFRPFNTFSKMLPNYLTVGTLLEEVLFLPNRRGHY